MIRSLALVCAIAAASVPPVCAQSFEEAVEEAQSAGPGVLPEPQFFISEMADLSRNWTVNAIYHDWVGEGPGRMRHWIVRRAVGGLAGQTGLVWADSRTCPEVRGILAAMENMAPPRPHAIGLHGEPERIVVVGHGILVTFRSRQAQAGSEGALLDMELTGNVNTPHAIWWAKSVEALQNCWTEARPE